MHLFGRKQHRPEKAGKGTEATTDETAREPERDRLFRQLEDERRQRLEDVHKERSERLAAQEEQRRLKKENRQLTEEARNLRLSLQEEKARAARKGLLETLFGGERNEKPSDER